MVQDQVVSKTFPMGSSILPVQSRAWVFSVEAAAPHPDVFILTVSTQQTGFSSFQPCFLEVTFQNFTHTLPRPQPKCYQLRSFGCTQLSGGCEANHFRQHSIIPEKPSRQKWKPGSRAWADTFQLNCFPCSSHCPKAICPSLHSFNCLLTLSTCLLSCPQSRTQLAQLPAHAPPCLEIKQLLLEMSLSNITLHLRAENKLTQKA